MRGIRIGSAFGIPLKLNWTFLIVLPLFAAFIAWDVAQLVSVINQTFGTTIDSDQLTVGLTPWILGLVSALGLFFGVLLHELGHSLVAMRYGYQIDSITLWLLGGVASFTDFPENWRHEFWIAIVGPSNHRVAVVSSLSGDARYDVRGVQSTSRPNRRHPGEGRERPGINGSNIYHERKSSPRAPGERSHLA